MTCHGLCTFSICFCESLTSTQCQYVGGNPSCRRSGNLERSDLQAILWSGHLNGWVAIVCQESGKYNSKRHRIFSDVLRRKTPQVWVWKKMYRVHRLDCSSHGVAAAGLDVGWDPDALWSNPRCCMRLHKSLLLNLSAKRPKRTRLRLSNRTSELSFLASCFILSRCSRKLTIFET